MATRGINTESTQCKIPSACIRIYLVTSRITDHERTNIALAQTLRVKLCMCLHVLDNAKTEGLTLQRFVSGIVTEQVLPHMDCGLQSSESATFAALTISTMCVSSQAHSIRTKWYEAGSRASLRPLN